MNEPKLVPILWIVLNTRFEKSMWFFFKWQSRLPVLIVTKKQLHNFAHDIADHAVYETAMEYRKASR